MRRKHSLIVTEAVLFFSIFKWVGLASLIGGGVGIMCAFFLKTLSFSIEKVSSVHAYLFLPIGMFISVVLTHYLSKDSSGHGTEKVIEAVHRNAGKIRFRVVPVKLLTTVVTIASGGSAGKEGPCAQIGAGLASTFASLFKFSKADRKKLVICGISAGFSAVFGTPIAGAIFGVEVLFVGNLLYDVLLPSFVSGMVGYQMCKWLGVSYAYHYFELPTHFNPSFFLLVLASGLFFGIVSLFFIEVIQFGEELSHKFKIWEPLKGILGGVVLIVFALVFSNDYLGLGLEFIHKTLSGYEVMWYAFIVKAIVTSITLGFGGSGGILTPIFFIGASAGSFFAMVFGVDITPFAAIGFVSVLAGAANTPISASILAVELFGPTVAPYASLACVISFLMTGNRSVYPSQVMAMTKTEAFKFVQGKEVCDSETRIRFGTKKLMVNGRNFLRRIQRFMK